MSNLSFNQYHTFHCYENTPDHDSVNLLLIVMKKVESNFPFVVESYRMNKYICEMTYLT